MIGALIYIVVVCAVAALILWAVRELGTPDPVARVVRVVVIVIAILIVIGVVAGLLGVHTGLPMPGL
jgi:heme A synthase